MNQALAYCQKRIKWLETLEKKYAKEARSNRTYAGSIWSDNTEMLEREAHELRKARLQELRKINNLFR